MREKEGDLEMKSQCKEMEEDGRRDGEKCDRKMYSKCLYADSQLAVCVQRGAVGREMRGRV